METASTEPALHIVISSLKPFCLWSKGRISFSSVRVNSACILGFKPNETFRAYIFNLLEVMTDKRERTSDGLTYFSGNLNEGRVETTSPLTLGFQTRSVKSV